MAREHEEYEGSTDATEKGGRRESAVEEVRQRAERIHDATGDLERELDREETEVERLRDMVKSIRGEAAQIMEASGELAGNHTKGNTLEP
jgi:predicted nuclease with TOPRIM domain